MKAPKCEIPPEDSIEDPQHQVKIKIMQSLSKHVKMRANCESNLGHNFNNIIDNLKECKYSLTY